MDEKTEAVKTLSEHIDVLEKILIGNCELLGIEGVPNPVETTGAKILEMQATVIAMVDNANAIKRSLSGL